MNRIQYHAAKDYAARYEELFDLETGRPLGAAGAVWLMAQPEFRDIHGVSAKASRAKKLYDLSTGIISECFNEME